MKKITLSLLAWVLAANLFAQVTATRNLMPVPAEVTWGEGHFSLSPDFRAIRKDPPGSEGPADPRVVKGVQRFMARLARSTQLVFTNGASSPALTVQYDQNGLPVQSFKEDESYDLMVTPTAITLSAPNPLGVLHGLQTLLQLVEKSGDGYVIPVVTIRDKPRFAWRGLLIDVSRHWMPVEVIERNLDGLEEAKMNVLHWHLSDDQGFRVESLVFPKLQQLASDGNYYTQDQIKEVVAYARTRGIRVVPEFDIPGHTTALVTAYPELASAPGPFSIERKFGVLEPTLDPTKEEVYAFLDKFLAEMTQLFPDAYFHIGGDEVNGKEWNANRNIQLFMVEHHFKTNDDLQNYFNGRVLAFLTKDHKKMIGWDEILNPNLPKTIIVQSWRGVDSLVSATQKGYDAILSKNYYLDMQQPASFHYSVDPVPGMNVTPTPGATPGISFTTEQVSHLLGGEACMWSEFVSPETVDSRIWPRTLAVAERFWSPATVVDTADMYRRLSVENERLNELGLTQNSNQEAMMERLVGKEGADSLKVLADVLQPVKGYKRPWSWSYTSQTPLTRLVDIARPESETARLFSVQVDQFLQNGSLEKDARALTDILRLWKNNNKILEPILVRSESGVEGASQSEDLSTAAQWGLEAIHYLEKGEQAPQAWQDKAKAALDRAQSPHAEVELAVVGPLRKLVLAAGEVDQLQTVKLADWFKSLNGQINAISSSQK